MNRFPISKKQCSVKDTPMSASSCLAWRLRQSGSTEYTVKWWTPSHQSQRKMSEHLDCKILASNWGLIIVEWRNITRVTEIKVSTVSSQPHGLKKVCALWGSNLLPQSIRWWLCSGGCSEFNQWCGAWVQMGFDFQTVSELCPVEAGKTHTNPHKHAVVRCDDGWMDGWLVYLKNRSFD